MAKKLLPQDKGAKVRIEVSGLPEVLAALARFGDGAPARAAEVLDKVADQMVRVARPMVPDDPETGASRLEGTLRRLKARVSKGAWGGGQRAEVSVAVGGSSLLKYLKGRKGPNVWALVQHNDSTLSHTRGRARFLEVAANQVAPGIPDALLAALDKEAAGAA